MYHVFAADFQRVKAEYWTLHFGDAAVAPVEYTVVVAGVVADIVNCPLPV